jgi:hypothetical protein
LPDRPDFAVRLAELFLAGAFLVFLAETFRLAVVTLRTTSLVVSPMDFWAAPALAARLPNVEPIVSATLTNNPLFLSSALLPSVIVRSSVAGLLPKNSKNQTSAHPYSMPWVRIVTARGNKLNSSHVSRTKFAKLARNFRLVCGLG